MKLDTSSYYPKSPLDDDDTEDWLHPGEKDEESETVGVKITEEVTDVISNEKIGNTSQSDTVEEVERNDDSNFLQDDGKPESAFSKVINVICTILSWVLVPLMMPLYGLLLVFNLSILHFMAPASKWAFILVTIGITIVLPGVLIYLLKRIGLIKDIGLNGRKERLIPYIISIVSMGGLGWFMMTKGAPMWLVMFFIAGGVAGVVNTIVNFWWKISAHSAGIAGIVALIIRISSEGYSLPQTQTWLVISIIAAGLLGSARIWQGRHTLGQVLCGYLVGFTSVLLMTLI